MGERQPIRTANRFEFDLVTAVATTEPFGASCWRFER